MIGSLFKSEGENARKFAVQIKEIANHRFIQFLLFEVFFTERINPVTGTARKYLVPIRACYGPGCGETEGITGPVLQSPWNGRILPIGRFYRSPTAG